MTFNFSMQVRFSCQISFPLFIQIILIVLASVRTVFCGSIFYNFGICCMGNEMAADPSDPILWILWQAIDHIINSAAKTHYMSGGQISVPIVFRGPNGAAAGVGAQHSQA